MSDRVTLLRQVLDDPDLLFCVLDSSAIRRARVLGPWRRDINDVRSERFEPGDAAEPTAECYPVGKEWSAGVDGQYQMCPSRREAEAYCDAVATARGYLLCNEDLRHRDTYP